MFPTSELKTAGPSLEGCGRYSLPRIEATDLGEAGRKAPGAKTPRKKNFLRSSPNSVGMWVGVWGGVPRRRQVDISLPLRAPRPGVNVPNHVNFP